MKRCPQCRRDYYDDSLQYCLEDGAALIQGSVPSSDEPPTAILHETASPGESTTRAQIHTTEKTALSPSRATYVRRPVSSNMLLLLGLLCIAIFVVGGFMGYRYLRSGGKQIESLAVLPFVNDSGNADLDYLSDGMTETLISNLSQLPALNVKPRSMVFRYKGKDVDLRTIGSELGVEAVLNGRLVPRGGDISLFVELVDVASTKVIWSRQYNRKQAELVSFQSDIARDVSSKLRNALSGDEEKKVTQNGTNDPEAYRLYLLARSFAERRKEKDAMKAIEYFEQAIARDPNYVAAYGGLARAYMFTAVYGSVPFSEALLKARAAQLRVLELAPDLPDAHVGLAANMLLTRDFAGSEREIHRALELNPEFAEAHRQNGQRLAYFGHLDEALAEFKRAIDLDPMAVTTRVNYATCLFFSGKYENSDAEFKAVREIDPSVWLAEYQLFSLLRGRGDYSAAVEHLARAQELRDEPEAAKFIRDRFGSGGWNGMMRAAIDDPEKAKIWDYNLASFAAELGDKDKAFALLNTAADKYDQFVLFAKVDPAMEPLRADPRYGAFLTKLGLQ